jgi:two-component system KDP operon response regulator KdpE
MTPNSDDIITIGDITIQPVHRVVKKGGSSVYLTPREFSLLHYLMAHAGPPIPHSQLLYSVWGSECTAKMEYLRTYMRQLRQKLEDDVAHPAYLLTNHTRGYRFIAADEWNFVQTKAGHPPRSCGSTPSSFA